MHLLATDGVYNARGLERVDLSEQGGASLVLFPGNRVDLVVQCREEAELLLKTSPRPENDALLGPLALRLRQDLLSIHVSRTGEATDAQGQLMLDALPQALPPLPPSLSASEVNVSDVPASEVFKYRVELGSGGTREVPFVTPATPKRTDKVLVAGPEPAAMLPLRNVNGRTFDAGAVRHCIEVNSVQEWEIVGRSERLATFSFQAHHFQVVGGSTGARHAADAGVWRDVYGVGAGSSVTIRFRARNETGEYLFGSSIASDHDLGQAVVVEVAESCAQCASLVPPPLTCMQNAFP